MATEKCSFDILMIANFFILMKFLKVNKARNITSLYTVFLVIMCCRLSAAFEYFLSNTSGEVGKENFIYYSLSYEGTILLELTSFVGDCDLYVSQTRKQPSYEPDSNCLQSTTCGVDSIIIPKSFKRPIGIGIFGHPSYEFCAYNLKFFRVHESRDIFNFDPYQESIETTEAKKLVEDESVTSESEEESFFWFILRSAVFLMEIIL